MKAGRWVLVCDGVGGRWARICAGSSRRSRDSSESLIVAAVPWLSAFEHLEVPCVTAGLSGERIHSIWVEVSLRQTW